MGYLMDAGFPSSASLEGLLVEDDLGRSLSARAITDPDIYQLELERLFRRTWLFVAHEAEIPAPGDFVCRRMASDPVIVTRGDDKSVSVLLNSCSHRGAQVCRGDRGTAFHFTCPYHGWAYRRDGSFIGAAAEKVAYDQPLHHERLGLASARVESYRGLVFATWSDSAPSLREYLGDALWYLDMVFDLTEAGTAVAGPPHRWIIPMNWKLGAENFLGDAYHGSTSHASMEQVGLVDTGSYSAAAVGISVSDPVYGHGLFFPDLRSRFAGVPDVKELMFRLLCGRLPEASLNEARRRLLPEHWEILAGGAYPTVGTVFPNFSFLIAPSVTELGEAPGPNCTIRVWNPVSHDQVELWSWVLVEHDSPPDVRQRVQQTVTRTFSTSGIFEQDDVEVWSSIQRGLSGSRGRERYLDYNATRPVGGQDWPEPGRSWPGPGDVRMGFSNEDVMWSFYRRWESLLRGVGS